MLTSNDYIALYKDAAIQAAQGTGLFASVLLAQGLIESGDGNSVLASKYNNHFGIKADSSWTGKSVNLATKEVVNGVGINTNANFRVYDNALQSYADIVKFLQTNSRYHDNGVFSATTPQAQAEALQKAGYATDPNYAIILENVIKRENLGIFDAAVSYSTAYVKKNAVTVVIIVLLFILLLTLLIRSR